MDDAPGPVAGVDIDGVLADPTHRLHFIEQRPKDWGGFFTAAKDDEPLVAGQAYVQRLVDQGIAILYVTGRPEYTRRATRQWLERHGFPEAPVYLRPRGDFRPAPVLKREIYERLTEHFDLHVIVDDDEAVVAELRDAGLPVELADWYRPGQTARTTLADVQDRKGIT